MFAVLLFLIFFFGSNDSLSGAFFLAEIFEKVSFGP